MTRWLIAPGVALAAVLAFAGGRWAQADGTYQSGPALRYQIASQTIEVAGTYCDWSPTPCVAAEIPVPRQPVIMTATVQTQGPTGAWGPTAPMDSQNSPYRLAWSNGQLMLIKPANSSFWAHARITFTAMYLDSYVAGASTLPAAKPTSIPW